METNWNPQVGHVVRYNYLSLAAPVPGIIISTRGSTIKVRWADGEVLTHSRAELIPLVQTLAK